MINMCVNYGYITFKNDANCNTYKLYQMLSVNKTDAVILKQFEQKTSHPILHPELAVGLEDCFQTCVQFLSALHHAF